ncbi:MAG: hypothetical protein AB7C90_02515 [Bacteroidales bacterium]
MKQKKSFEIRDWHINALIFLVILGLVFLARLVFSLASALYKLI